MAKLFYIPNSFRKERPQEAGNESNLTCDRIKIKYAASKPFSGCIRNPCLDNVGLMCLTYYS